MSRKSKGRVDLDQDVSQLGGGTGQPQPGTNAQGDETIEAGRDQVEDRAYLVGYRKPPVATRFKPGQSGNPKGRRKGIRSLAQILRDAVNEKVTVRTAQGDRKMSKAEAIVHTNLNKALQGDAKAADRLIKLMHLCGIVAPSPADADQHVMQQLSEEDAALLARLSGQQDEP